MGDKILLLDQQNSKFLDMESIKSYSNTDEYLYAMKEDLAEWFNSMYSTNLNAETFMDSLENGVLICEHAKQVIKAVACLSMDLQQHSFIPYRADAKPQSFQARDNISNFIKWCRSSAKVRECLMFETDDVILRKNEKNFILCLLEVARYGSKYGVQVPTIIKLEQEIDNELKQEEMLKNKTSLSSSLCDDTDIHDLDEDSLENEIKSSSISISPSSSLTSSTSSLTMKTKSLLQEAVIDENELKIDIKPATNSTTEATVTNEFSSISSISPPTSTSSISLTDNLNQLSVKEKQEPKPKKFVKKSLNNEFYKNMPASKLRERKSVKKIKSESDSSSIKNNDENSNKCRSSSSSSRTDIETELERHVNKLVNRCTCEKKFPVIQIGEGKYRIGSTNAIVFIRVIYSEILIYFYFSKIFFFLLDS